MTSMNYNSLNTRYAMALKEFQKIVFSEGNKIDQGKQPSSIVEEKALDEQEFLKGLYKKNQESIAAQQAKANLKSRNNSPSTTNTTSAIKSKFVNSQKSPSPSPSSSALPIKQSPISASVETLTPKVEDVSAKIARLLEQSNAVKEKYSSKGKTSTTKVEGEQLSSFFDSLLQ